KLGFTPFVFVEIIKAILVTIFGLALIRALSHTNKYFTN
ncbi:BioY family transporter, partial [Citrobacter sp. TBCS-11]